MLADECLWSNADSFNAALILARRAVPIPVAQSLRDGCELGSSYDAWRYASMPGVGREAGVLPLNTAGMQAESLGQHLRTIYLRCGIMCPGSAAHSHTCIGGSTPLQSVQRRCWDCVLL